MTKPLNTVLEELEEAERDLRENLGFSPLRAREEVTPKITSQLVPSMQAALAEIKDILEVVKLAKHIQARLDRQAFVGSLHKKR